jgi:hypothetical protein
MTTTETDLPYDIEVAGPDVQAHFRKMIADGQTPRFAEMCSLQQPPGVSGVDRTFQEGHLDGNWMDALPKKQAQRMIREAKKAGVNVAGKYYFSGIADSRGAADPRAWVSSRDDVLQVCKDRRLEIKGTINYSPGEAAPPKRVDMAPRLVNEMVKKHLAANPGTSRADAVEAVKKKHALKRKL